MYEGVATFDTGETIQATGTFQELANWADNIIREHAGGISINIEMKDKK